MKIAIISDDLTGASDTGGQLVPFGINVRVIIGDQPISWNDNDAVIINTDSRSIPTDEAFKRVRDVSRRIYKEDIDLIYKKIDSTMRGNIGVELNALHDVFHPDFIIIAPAYPNNGRVVVNGVHLFNGVELANTEVAKDPKTPVTNSYIPGLLEQQTERKLGHLSLAELRNGTDHILEKLQLFKKKGISYISVDTASNEDFDRVIDAVRTTNYRVIWSGSAGLIHSLSRYFGMKPKDKEINLPEANTPMLFVIGSVSKIGRKQLNELLAHDEIAGIEIDTAKLFGSDEQKEKENKRVFEKATKAIQSSHSVALFTSIDMEQTRIVGTKKGCSPIEISNAISIMLGEIAVQLIKTHKLSRLFLTGGDTAQQVLSQLNVNEFSLIGELESGVPIGSVIQGWEIFTITKAGNFGSQHVMVKALSDLKGKKCITQCGIKEVWSG